MKKTIIRCTERIKWSFVVLRHSNSYVGYLRSGFEFFLAGFAAFSTPIQIISIQVELDKLYPMHYLLIIHVIPEVPKMLKYC